jgi:hypothetical protein
MGIAMPNLIAVARQSADEIRRIVCSHNCRDPEVVDYDDPEYDVTLLVASTEQTSLFDLGGIMNDIEEPLGIHAFVVTRESFEETVAVSGNRPRVLAL